MKSKLHKCNCRFCGKELRYTFADLGVSPLANNFVSQEEKHKAQLYLPLHVMVCEYCYLVQVSEYEEPENIFSDYKYFSSYSNSWLEHCDFYVNMITDKLNLNSNSRVIEVASNDGYLLQYFQPKGIKTLGIEPAKNVAEFAIQKGIDTIVDFFGKELAEKLKKDGITADLIVGNNVLAHVPDIRNFVEALKIILKPAGSITMEFPHIVNLIAGNQFDTIYHEHFSYLSILAIKRIFREAGLEIYEVEKMKTHGGSIRIYAKHEENDKIAIHESVNCILEEEKVFGLDRIETYTNFSAKIKTIKCDVWAKLVELKRNGKTIVGYGAAAKGNTLLNYCGIGNEILDYVVDISPHKQGFYLPGSSLPILKPEEIMKTKPDYVLLIPWNLQDEIVAQLKFIRNWGGKFIILIPEIREL